MTSISARRVLIDVTLGRPQRLFSAWANQGEITGSKSLIVPRFGPWIGKDFSQCRIPTHHAWDECRWGDSVFIAAILRCVQNDGSVEAPISFKGCGIRQA
jgi:hypothetical protein